MKLRLKKNTYQKENTWRSSFVHSRLRVKGIEVTTEDLSLSLQVAELTLSLHAIGKNLARGSNNNNRNMCKSKSMIHSTLFLCFSDKLFQKDLLHFSLHRNSEPPPVAECIWEEQYKIFYCYHNVQWSLQRNSICTRPGVASWCAPCPSLTALRWGYVNNPSYPSLRFAGAWIPFFTIPWKSASILPLACHANNSQLLMKISISKARQA